MKTEHNVTPTQGFYLGKYEVTQAQYEAVMTSNTGWAECYAEQLAEQPEPSGGKGFWADAQIFWTRLNDQRSASLFSGWAYVFCRPKPNGNMPAERETTSLLLGEIRLQGKRTRTTNYGIGQTRGVGQYAAQPLGLRHALERLGMGPRSWKANYPVVTSPIHGSGARLGRIRRGGAWGNNGSQLRSAKTQ